ncbi:MAG: response regulator [Bosea sp. (in: a-proteobacteria)]|jgi:CheY-like chemotaxis protein
MARILVVDDEEAVRSLIARGLALDSHTVEMAGDGAEALDVITAREGSFDLVLSDIRMPLMDGIAMALAAKRDFPDLVILLMTGYAEQRERAKSLENIVVDVLTKPFGLAELRSTVARVLEQTRKG